MDKTNETSTAVETGGGTNLDPVVVMAEHSGAHENYAGRVCIPCDDYWPCLPYRLAALAQEQAVALAQVEAESDLRTAEYAVISLEGAADDLHIARDLASARRYVDERLTETRNAVAHYRAALAGEQ